VKLFFLSLWSDDPRPLFGLGANSGIHFWTLCIEEQFYLIYPLILLGTPPKWRFRVLIGLLLASIGFRLMMRLYLPSSSYGLLLPVCGEYLIWGSLFAYAETKAKFKNISPPLLFYSGLFLTLLLFIFKKPVVPVELLACYPSNTQTLLEIGFALIILGLWKRDNFLPAKWLSFRPFSYLGKISYGLYLIHFFTWGLGWWFKEKIQIVSMVPAILLRFILTVSLAMLSWHLYEAPINNLKKRFQLKKQRSTGGAIVDA